MTVTTVAKPVHEPRYSLMESTSRNSYTSTSGVDTTDNETDELSNIRGILKNKPVKPKPYHLGENIESADVLWSVPAMKADRESPSARDSGKCCEDNSTDGLKIIKCIFHRKESPVIHQLVPSLWPKGFAS